MHGTLPRSSARDRDSGVQMNGVVPMSSKSISEMYIKNDYATAEPSVSSAVRRPNSRNLHLGSVGTSRKPLDVDSRDDVNCSQKIKPEILCYSPVHYSKPNGLSGDFERLKVSKEPSPRDRNPTVTHVSTSFIPVKSLPIEQTLLTSSAYLSPNSRTSLKDIRRCSIYDNMPPSDDRRSTSAIPPRSLVSSSYPSNPTVKYVSSNQDSDERRKSWHIPAYVDPPPYDRSRTSQSAANAKNQPGTLLQRFNVPASSRYSETTRLPDDVRRINENVGTSRPRCQRCHQTYVERNAMFCAPCQALDSMLYDLNDETAIHY